MDTLRRRTNKTAGPCRRPCQPRSGNVNDAGQLVPVFVEDCQENF